MKVEPGCEQCRLLLDGASAAIIRYVRTTDRLELARFRHEAETIAALEAAVREAASARERALADYKQHQAASHSRAATGGV
jgi:hypothetical protein